ncbi:MAG: NAD-dependent epimerase/dehydratase family protein [Acidimicrobiales bacterium]
MRVLVAGATGAIGRQLVPHLVAAGHEVHGMTRSGSKEAMLRELGAVPVVADALDPGQVAEAVGRAAPEVIVHELTAIGALDTRRFDREFAPTNRLRTEGTDHLLSAGQAVGVRRFVAQSVAGFGAYARTGGAIKTEEDPLDPAPVREMSQTLGAIRHLEEAVLGAKKPVRVPRLVGRTFAGEAGVVMMTEVRGASNAKAKRELGWDPTHPSWRQGLAP